VVGATSMFTRTLRTLTCWVVLLESDEGKGQRRRETSETIDRDAPHSTLQQVVYHSLIRSLCTGVCLYCTCCTASRNGKPQRSTVPYPTQCNGTMTSNKSIRCVFDVVWVHTTADSLLPPTQISGKVGAIDAKNQNIYVGTPNWRVRGREIESLNVNCADRTVTIVTATHTFTLEHAVIPSSSDASDANANINQWETFCSRVQALADRHQRSSTRTIPTTTTTMTSNKNKPVPTTTATPTATTTDTAHDSSSKNISNKNINSSNNNKIRMPFFHSSSHRRRKSSFGSAKEQVGGILVDGSSSNQMITTNSNKKRSLSFPSASRRRRRRRSIGNSGSNSNSTNVNDTHQKDSPAYEKWLRVTDRARQRARALVTSTSTPHHAHAEHPPPTRHSRSTGTKALAARAATAMPTNSNDNDNEREEYNHDNDEPMDVDMDADMDMDTANMDCFEHDDLEQDPDDSATTACYAAALQTSTATTTATMTTATMTTATMTTTPLMTMTAHAATVVTDATTTTSSGPGSGTSAESVSIPNSNADTDTNMYTDRIHTDHVKRAIVFAPPSSSPKNAGMRMETSTNTSNYWSNDDSDDSDDNNRVYPTVLNQEPFLVSVLFGQQTVGVGVVDNDDDNLDHEHVNRDEFGDMVRSWLVTVTCCFVVCLVLIAAAATAGVGVGTHVEWLGGHPPQGGPSVVVAVPAWKQTHDFWKKQDEDWTMPSASGEYVRCSPVLTNASHSLVE
jgi:hypothetical protein